VQLNVKEELEEDETCSEYGRIKRQVFEISCSYTHGFEIGNTCRIKVVVLARRISSFPGYTRAPLCSDLIPAKQALAIPLMRFHITGFVFT